MVQTRSQLLFSVLFLLAAGLYGQHSLEVRVEGIRSSEGTLEVAVYSEEAFFLKMEGVYRAKRVPAEQGQTRFQIADLPAGEYAVAIYHDENGNGELDKNWIGIPKEPLGFSNARLKTFGPPSFEECRFQLSTDHSLVIQME